MTSRCFAVAEVDRQTVGSTVGEGHCHSLVVFRHRELQTRPPATGNATYFRLWAEPEVSLVAGGG